MDGLAGASLRCYFRRSLRAPVTGALDCIMRVTASDAASCFPPLRGEASRPDARGACAALVKPVAQTGTFAGAPNDLKVL